MRKKIKFLNNQKGQVMTEFMVVIVLLIAIVLLHTQLSLSYVVNSIFRYTTFMAARAEAVKPGSGEAYIKEFVGDVSASKLRPLATLLPPTGGGYVTGAQGQQQEEINVGYEVLTYVPFIDATAAKLTKNSSKSFIQREPFNNLGVITDNDF